MGRMTGPSKYEIVERLGAGPRATLYRGRQTTLGVAVAIKELYPSLTPAARQRLFAAVDRWVQSAHENLLLVRDADSARGWIITDLMQGSFAGQLALKPVAPGRVQEVLVQCLTALDYLHVQRSSLHANLKPANILYDPQGRIRLSDGYCVPLGPGMELPAPTPGCNKYLAPETLSEGTADIGPAADLYCLGFTMLELLIGPQFDSLFRGVTDDPKEVDRAWLRWHLSPAEAAPRVCDHVAVRCVRWRW